MFLQDQLRDRSVLFGDDTRRQFYAPQQTTRGTPVPMTLGWHIGDRDSRRFFYKEGGGGFHCMMRLYTGDGLRTVVMTNATGFDVGKLLDTIDPPFCAGSVEQCPTLAAGAGRRSAAPLTRAAGEAESESA